MSHSEGIQVLTDTYHVLQDAGVLFPSLKVDSQRKTLKKESISTPGSIKTYTYFGENEIEDILREIGFDIIKTHTWMPQADCWKILIAKK